MDGFLYPIFLIFILLFIFGIRIVRPTQRGLIERLGKYHKFARPGFHWIIPAKIVVPANTELVNVIGDLSGVLPLKKDK